VCPLSAPGLQDRLGMLAVMSLYKGTNIGLFLLKFIVAHLLLFCSEFRLSLLNYGSNRPHCGRHVLIVQSYLSGQCAPHYDSLDPHESPRGVSMG